MPNVKPSLDTIFSEAIEFGDAADRAAFLAKACGDNDALRLRIEALVAAHDSAGSFLEPSPDLAKGTLAAGPAAEEPGTLVGPYKLLQQIGEGGMGTVYMAEQSHPVQRKVALKIIKAGLDSRQVIARFEAERQALALMDHPNIARVFEAGTTESGRPYFAMELVKGQSITKYCDEHRLTPRQRLELFLPVCQAIQHAHQKGIIHRDIKASNVLIAPFDGKPVVKVIDFGIAKATGQRLTDKTLFTEFGAVVGTLEYMSPEQAELNNQDIDTRSDIYSLGVLLYELLTGTTPLDPKRLKNSAFMEMLRIIREEEPPKPSTRLSESHDSLPAISAQRQMEPAKLTRVVRGELDWIVMKALEKDRTRRYDTGSAFAADVQRYLNDEQVEACPPSAAYRFRKFARRNKAALTTCALVLAALLLGTAVSVWQAVEATEARELADKRLVLADERLENEKQARIREVDQRKKAEAATLKESEAKQVADERQKQAEATAKLLASMFKNLDPNRDIKDGMDLKDRLLAQLDEVADQLEREPADRLTQSRLQDALGAALRGLGEPNKAVIHLQRALEARQDKLSPDHASTLSTMHDLAGAYHEAGKLNLALPLLEQTLEKRKAINGAGHHETLVTMNNLGAAYLSAGKFDLALPLLGMTLKMRKAKFGPNHRETLIAMNTLSNAYLDAGNLDLALPLLKETLEKEMANSGPYHRNTLLAMNNLAAAYTKADMLDLALPLLKETLKTQKAKLVTDHPDTLVTMDNLVRAYREADQLNLALSLSKETVEKWKAKLGPDHPDTLISMGILAGTYQAAGKLNLALPLFKETLEKQKVKLATDHPSTLSTMYALAKAYRDANRLDLTLPLLKETLEKRKTKLGADHPDTLAAMNELAVAYLEAGVRDLALPLLKEALEKKKVKLGTDHADVLLAMNNLAGAYKEAGMLDLALPLFEQTLKKLKAKLGTDHPDALRAMHNLGATYREAGKLDLAVPLLKETLEKSKAKLGPDHPNTLQTMNSLAFAYQSDGKLDLALPLFEHTLEKWKAKVGADHPGTLNTMNNLAGAYGKTGKVDKEESLFRESLQRAKKQGPESLATATTLSLLSLNLISQKKYVQAEQMLRECLSIRQKKQPDVWTTFNAKSQLGGALLGQEKYADAETLLLEGYEGMKQRETAISAGNMHRLFEAVERLVQLYEATKQPEKARMWKEKLPPDAK